MVEIAMCLAIVSFALVAILGVLPTGLTVQKANLEDTIILQEGNFLIEAIRSGARNVPQLTNFVDYIRITNSASPWYGVTNFRSSDDVIGLLSYPKYTMVNGRLSTNTVAAKFRAMSGSASDKGRSAGARDFAFSYIVNSEVAPYAAYAPVLTNWIATGLAATEVATRSNRWGHANFMATNLYELRLTLRWPVRPDGTTGNNAQTFRTLVTGSLQRQIGGTNFYFLPSTYGY
jgi:hypothetical protein